MTRAYKNTPIGRGKLLHEAMRRKRMGQGAAVFIAALGVAGIVVVNMYDMESELGRWVFHQSLWALGIGVFTFITVTKYNKMPVNYGEIPAWRAPR